MNKQEIQEMYRNFSAKFSNKLLYKLVDSEGNNNIAISPSRLQNVLVLLANWASPQIRKAILEGIGSEVMEMDEANVLCNKEHLHLTSWKEGEGDYIPTIETNTFLWVKKGMKLKPDGLTCVSSNFNVVLREVDFSQPDTKDIINKAVDVASHGLIKEVNSDIQPHTQMLLTDILYFKAKWDERFYEEDTKERIFYGTKGKEKVPMMKKTDSLMFSETQTCQVVQLRYMCMSEQDKYFTMRIYMPKEKCSISDVLHELWNNEFYFDMTEEDVKLTLPKFTIKSNAYMKQVLKDIGLECIFESADIVPGLVNDVRIDDISQQVKIKVDENETEAAALTEMCVAMGPPPTEIREPVIMNVNRPFMFEIAEEYSNTILFTGIINHIEE
jgi:serine protease inhibitor